MIRLQRSTTGTASSKLTYKENVWTKKEDVLQAWHDYFHELASTKYSEDYNDSFLCAVKEDVLFIEDYCRREDNPVEPVAAEQIRKALSSLNNNKAADTLSLTAEHLKKGGETVVEALVYLVNRMFRVGKVPPALKEGLVTPVHKKGPKDIPSNYRGITVTPVLLKVAEKVINMQMNDRLESTQSRLQKGFTKCSSASNAALILTELIAESYENKKTLFLTTLDAQKAFDVVNHDILLRRLFLDGVGGDMWLLMKNMYSDMQSMVKWDGDISDQIPIEQGVRQGGVLSTVHYKRYNNPLLLSLEAKCRGAALGSIPITHITVADDVALVSHTRNDQQHMANRVQQYSRDHHYSINPTKSATVIWNGGKNIEEVVVGDSKVEVVREVTHLGMTRTNKNKLDTDRRLAVARRTAYALMGAGLHGNSGLTPVVGFNIYNQYILPRFLYGLETVVVKYTDVGKLEGYQKKFLKSIQALPMNCSDVAVYALSGVLPLPVMLEKKKLLLLRVILAGETTVEREIAERQFAVKDLDSEHSWFVDIRYLLHKYHLPSVYSLMEELPSAETWKRQVRTNVECVWVRELRENIVIKEYLKYINVGKVEVGLPHTVWRSTRNNQRDIKRASIKAKVITGSYVLQKTRSKYWRSTESAICLMCGMGDETTEHFLAECSSLAEERQPHLNRLRRILQTEDKTVIEYILLTPGLLSALLLDPSLPAVQTLIDVTPDVFQALELTSRECVFSLHQRRMTLLQLRRDGRRSSRGRRR